MATADKATWEASVDCEHEHTLKNNVWELVDSNKVPPGFRYHQRNVGDEKEGKW